MSVYLTSTIYRPSATAYKSRGVQVPLYKGDPAPVYEDVVLMTEDQEDLVDSAGDELLARDRL